MSGFITQIVEVDSLDKDGDGVAYVKGERVKVPYSLPGEVCEIQVPRKFRGRGAKVTTLCAVTNPVPSRKEPVCTHFSQCGGCHLQHLSDQDYMTYKKNMVVDRLAECDIDASVVRDFVSVPLDSRRRVTLKVFNGVIGYHAYRSHHFIPISECVILLPTLQQLLAPLNILIGSLECSSSITEIQLLASDTGVAMLLSVGREVLLSDIERLTQWAEDFDLASLYYHDGKGKVPVIERRAVELFYGDTKVQVSVDSFQQASKYAQSIMIDIIQDELVSADAILDLYSGTGTYSLSLGKKKKIHAVEGSDIMVSAMRRAIHQSSLDGYLSVELRDLWNNPLMEDELSSYDAVIINPPRNGAGAQVKQLSGASIDTVMMVSCSIDSFFRDLVSFRKEFILKYIIIIDQFLYSNNIELVGCFSKKY